MAVLPTLATVAQLNAAAQREVPADVAEFALAVASAKVRTYTRQTISLVVDDAVDLGPTYSDELRLPQRPVLSVSSIEVDGVVLDSGSYRLRGDVLVSRCGWSAGAVVTYTHGWDPIPDDVAGVVADLAKVGVTNPGMLRSLAIDDYTETYATEAINSATLTASQKADLGPYRRRVFSVAPS